MCAYFAGVGMLQSTTPGS